MAAPAKPKAREEQPPQSPELARVRGAEAGLADAQRVLDAAQVAAQEAEAHVQKCESTCGAARARHDEAPTPTPADAALARAVRLRTDAGARLAAAIESAGVAKAALDAAKLVLRTGELREAAAPATLAAAIAKPWADLIAGNGRPAAQADAIRTAWGQSLAASAALRSLGKHVPDLDPLHPLLPALRDLAERGHVVMGALEHSQVRRIPLTGAALVGLLEGAYTRALPADHVAAFRARLAYFAATRTWHEAFALEEAEGKAAQAARDASPEGQENARRMAEHVERTSRPPRPRP